MGIMISTKWFQGIESKHNFLEIRKSVFCEELKVGEESISDFYDQFAFNVVLYDDDKSAGTGRLIFKDGKYFIDKLCVLKKFRGNNYSDLIIRMLIRKAVNIGAEKTYASIDKKYRLIFKKIGFEEIETDSNVNILMMKEGDVGGNCS